MSKPDNAPTPKENQASNPEPDNLRSDETTSQLVRQNVENNPLLEPVQLNNSLFPVIQVPTLEGIQIDVPSPEPITEEDITERFEQLYYELLHRENRAKGDPIQYGDEVTLDLIGYVSGELLPFSASEGLRVRLEEDVCFPGFGTKLEGLAVDSQKVILTRTEDGQELLLAVSIVSAAVLEDIEPDSPEMLARFQRGDTLPEILEHIAEELVQEEASALVLRGFDLVMEELLKRAPIDIPRAPLEEEIRYWWRLSEGDFLARHNVEQTDLEASLRYWQDDDTIREEAIHRLQRTLLLKAYFAKEGKKVNKLELKGFLEELAPTFGLDAKVLQGALEQHAKEQSMLIQTYEAILALSHIISQVELRYT